MIENMLDDEIITFTSHIVKVKLTFVAEAKEVV